MKLADLDFIYPEKLVAIEPRRPSRVMWVEGAVPHEISLADLLSRIPAGDLLVVNDTRVLRRRVFANGLEILFLNSADGQTWEVLFPSRAYKLDDIIELPEGRKAKLVRKGRPQSLQTDGPLDEAYFERAAELPLPPYIQKARGERHTKDLDDSWYQTAWAAQPGSLAAPTASLHFSDTDLQTLRQRGVRVESLTLHVGLGTFLPVTAEDLDQHDMHAEDVAVSAKLMNAVTETKTRGGRVWCLGTTACRGLESAAQGLLPSDGQGGFRGETRLLIQPGYEWRVTDRLLTNFHQPQSTLLALVAAWAGLEKVKSCYAWAIEKEFRLFSYGDLSVWHR